MNMISKKIDKTHSKTRVQAPREQPAANTFRLQGDCTTTGKLAKSRSRNSLGSMESGAFLQNLSLSDWGAIGGIVGGMAAALTVPISIYFGWRNLPQNNLYLRFVEQLSDPDNRCTLKNRYLNEDLKGKYAIAVSGLNARFYDFFGPALSLRAFENCLRIALIYPMTIFITAWLFGANGTVGTLEVLPSYDEWAYRLIFFAVICTLFAVTFFAFIGFSGLIDKIDSFLESGSFHHGIAVGGAIGVAVAVASLLAIFIAAIIAIAVAIVGLIAVTTAAAAAFMSLSAGSGFGAFFRTATVGGAVSIAFAVALASGRNGLRASAINFAISVAVAMAVTFAMAKIVFLGLTIIVAIILIFPLAGTKIGVLTTISTLILSILSLISSIENTNIESYPIISITLFCGLLPFANALFDALSWLFTRGLIARIAKTKEGFLGFILILIDIIIDIFLAMACLGLLAALSAFLLETTNLILVQIGQNTAINWKKIMYNSVEQPFDPNSWLVVGMLGTTLIPTAIHIGVGLGGIVQSLHPGTAKAVRRISDTMTISDIQEVAHALARRESIGWIISSALGVVAFCVLIVSALSFAASHGQSLVKIAEQASCWSGNTLCPWWNW